MERVHRSNWMHGRFLIHICQFVVHVLESHFPNGKDNYIYFICSIHCLLISLVHKTDYSICIIWMNTVRKAAMSSFLIVKKLLWILIQMHLSYITWVDTILNTSNIFVWIVEIEFCIHGQNSDDSIFKE